jgi:hypothetical protein
VVTYLDPDGSLQSSAGAAHVPVADFERVLGVRGVDFGAASHGRIDALIQATPTRDRWAGGLRVSTSDAYAGVSIDSPSSAGARAKAASKPPSRCLVLPSTAGSPSEINPPPACKDAPSARAGSLDDG